MDQMTGMMCSVKDVGSSEEPLEKDYPTLQLPSAPCFVFLVQNVTVGPLSPLSSAPFSNATGTVDYSVGKEPNISPRSWWKPDQS